VPIAPDRILYEDDHLLAVEKLRGELVVKGSGAMGKLPLLDFLKKDYPGLRALHRIDFDTSGVVLFAKTKAAYDAVMNTKFDQWKKRYRALIMGQMDRQTGAIRTKLPVRMGRDMVDAETRYRTLKEFANSSYVDVEIETGRHHQIRRHFAAIKHPLVLDQLYGHKRFNHTFKQEFGYRTFFLHAASLALPHPITGKQLLIEAPLPRAFEEVLARLETLSE
jgi:23S rRNA pseudouridine955/2504/2580 synthase